MKEIRYIPFEKTDAQLKDEYMSALSRFLDEKQYILGKEVRKFEENWAAFCQTKYAVGVGNGYDALFLALKSVNLGPGDEIIVPSHTFAATTLAVVNTGATPILVDADPQTFNIDVGKIESSITSRTKAILVVHLYGNPCDMEKILSICDQHKLLLIEDNAQSHGARYKEKATGSFGIVSATSFYPVKNLGALGDAGIVNTSDENVFEKLKLLRNYGSPDKHKMILPGVNSRLDELQAAFLNIKLKHLATWNKERKKIANQYYRHLQDTGPLQTCMQPECVESANHIFPVLVKERDKLRAHLLSKGIHTLRHYPLPYHLEPAFSHLNYTRGSFPVTENICEKEISLPIFPGLKEDEVSFICKEIRSFYRSR